MHKSSIEIQGNDAKMAVMRSAFFDVQFQNLPYCHLNISRGPSTQFNESFHIKNLSTEIQLNVYWRCDGFITASTYNGKETNPWKKYNEVYRGKKFNSKIANDLCVQFLS